MRALAHLRRTICLAVLLWLGGSAPAFADATVILLNADPPGVGLNDPTPAVPIGGNVGVTVGEQRLIALQHAADIWGSQLDSAVPIVIFVSFGPRACTPTGAVLASAGPWAIFADFPGEVRPNTWHHSALADKRAGVDLAPDTPDIAAIFNINLGAPDCLAGSGWYYGLDANEPANLNDLVATALHEFAHGLGFSQFANVSTGVQIEGLSDVYGMNLLDTTTFKTWDQMTDAERAASAINSRRLVWDGPSVHAAVPKVLNKGTPNLRLTVPAAIAGRYQVGLASFGAPLTVAGVSGAIMLALDAADAAGPATTDACSPLTNAAAVAGRLALVDRGTCGFIVKAANVQAAGAIGMIVADNLPGSPPAGLGGVDPAITLPAVRITITDGAAIKAQLAQGVAVRGSLGLDQSLRAGADAQNRVFMNAPNPVVPGSTVSHWDPLAMPNLLMEPAINPDLTHSLAPPKDLTLALLRDIGWYPDADLDGFADDVDDCDSSDLRSTIFIGRIDTGVPSRMLDTGCTMNDAVALAAAKSKSHLEFVVRIIVLTEAWDRANLISDFQKLILRAIALLSDIPKKHK